MTTPQGVRAPDRWLAVLRMVVGAWFAKGVITKLGEAFVGISLLAGVLTDRKSVV